MKILVEQELTNNGLQKELFKKHGLITIAKNTDNIDLIIPTITGVDIDLDNPLVTIQEEKTDGRTAIVVKRHNHTSITPSGFSFELSNITSWIGETIVKQYSSLSMGQLYILYLNYQINRLLFDPIRENMQDLANGIARIWEMGYSASDEDANDMLIDLLEQVLQSIQVARTTTAEGCEFVDFFKRLFLNTISSKVDLYVHNLRLVETAEQIIKTDILLETSKDIKILRKTTFDEFEKIVLMNNLRDYIRSEFYKVQRQL